MSTYREMLWSRLVPLAKEAGLDIFDIETPSGSDARSMQGFLRIFITRAKSADSGAEIISDADARKGLTVDVSDCSRLSRTILDLADVEEILPGECQLEVSSPGINRKLSRSEHFRDAIGERLRLVVHDADFSGQGRRKREVLRGKLISFDGSKLEIEAEQENKTGKSNAGNRQLIEYKNVAEARVDFLFS